MTQCIRLTPATSRRPATAPCAPVLATRRLRRRLVVLCAALGLCLVAARQGDAASVNLLWDPVPGPTVMGYVVSWGTQPAVYTGRLNVGNRAAQEISGLADNATYYFVVQAFDQGGVLGPFSEEISSTAAVPALSIVCPAPTATSPDAQPVAVIYAPTTAGGVLPVTTSCAPPSGGLFPVGTSSFTCTATDAARQTASCSSSVRVSVPANPAPSISVNAPTAGSGGFTAPATLTLTATAADSNGTVTRVKFFVAGAGIGTVTTAPYTLTWSPVAAGTYAVTAVATDNAGATTQSSPRTVTVSGVASTNTPPTVSVTAPTGSFTAPATVTLSATAADSNGTVTRVKFFVGGVGIGAATTAPYTLRWSPVAAGSYAVTALATDNGGATTQSAPVTVTVAPSSGTTAAFVRTDTTTRGSWTGVYGRYGYQVVNESVALPAGTQVTAGGAPTFTWADTSADLRALQFSDGTGRLAATWYAASSFSLDVTFTDGLRHNVALYLLDWDQTGRSQRIDVLDAATGVVLDSRAAAGFQGGQYLVWTLSGHVTLRITNTGSPNAVVSGLFFDAPTAP